MRRIGIIGDDLSGTVALASEVYQGGLSCSVFSHPFSERFVSAEETDGIAVSVNSRNVSAMEAKSRVNKAATRLRKYGVKFAIKKHDSLLRGHILDELDGFRSAVGDALIFCTFAAPGHGRTTIDGIQYVLDVPLNEVQDSGSFSAGVPESSDVRALIESRFPNKTLAITIQDIRSGEESIKNRIALALDTDKSILVVDASSIRELDLATRAAVASGIYNFAGTSGIATAVVHATHLAAPPMVVVAGSLSNVASRQVDVAEESAFMTVVRIGPDSSTSELRLKFSQCSSALTHGRSLVLAPDTDVPVGRLQGIHEHLCTVAASVIERHCVSAVLATGGDTASALLKHLKAERLAMCAELVPGVSTTVLSNGPNQGLVFAVKPGSFGDKSILIRVASSFRVERKFDNNTD